MTVGILCLTSFSLDLLEPEYLGSYYSGELAALHLFVSMLFRENIEMNVSQEPRQTNEEFSSQHRLPEARGCFLGLRLDNMNAEQALSVVDSFVRDAHRNTARMVFFINVHSIHLSRKDKELHSCINEADLVLPDGSGLKIAGKILQRPIVENLNGTDFIPTVLERAARHQWSVFLFGARPGVVKQCRKHLDRVYPELNIVGDHHGHIDESDEPSLIAEINNTSPDILLVALGTPLQEKWIRRNASNLRVGVCFAVGGLFDFLSGEYRRAPTWIRQIGGESIFRFMQDPRSKWPRVFIEPPIFLLRVIRERVHFSRRLGSINSPQVKDDSRQGTRR